MKAITAYIKPHRLSEVTRALHRVQGLTGMSVTKVHGFGRGRVGSGEEPQEEHLKIEIFCSSELLEAVVSGIAQAAHTGLRGDGKIYISSIEDAVRISTGERGEAAV